MSKNREARLDTLEGQITGPKRIGLFGHRAVGKTTLLAMFYREASAGRVPGFRLAAGSPTTAEYLAAKIGQIEAGQPLAGTLSETELKLRLYHGIARLELIVRDYQGEHVELGSETAIREFFAGCDAVFFCLDAEGTVSPDIRLRRQLEIEEVLERFIEASDDVTTDRPVAVLVTKYDRVLAHSGPPANEVESLVEERFGITRHALAVHAPRSAIFAVSAYGPGATGDGKPPAELHPTGLDEPLAWLAEELERTDRERIDWLWDLAPRETSRMARCIRAYEKRYPRLDYAITLRRKLAATRNRRRGRLAASKYRGRSGRRRSPGWIRRMGISQCVSLRAGQPLSRGGRTALDGFRRLASLAPIHLCRTSQNRRNSS